MKEQMPDVIFAWKNQPSINVENHSSGKSWSSVDECENTEFESTKYTRSDIHEAVIAERDRMAEILRAARKELLLIKDDAFCDHSVGICSCEYWRTIKRIDDVLKTEKMKGGE